MATRSWFVLALLFLVSSAWSAVTSEVSRTDYVGTGSLAAYATTFPVKATTELRVFKQDADGQDVELTLGADYSAVLNTAGLATITLTAGNLTNGYKLSLQRGIPYTQTYNPAQSGAYNAASLGTALDRLNMEVIRLKGDVDRAIKIPYLEAGGDSVTKLDDNAAARANQTLGFDSSGNVMVGASVTGVDATPFAQTLLDDTTADAMRTTLGLPSQAMAARTVVANDTAGAGNGTARSIDDLTVLSDSTTTRRDLSARFADLKSVMDFGATGDGVADDTAEIQAALTAGSILLPPGKTFLISDTVTCPSDRIIVGYGATIFCASSLNLSKSALLLSDATFTTGIQNVTVYGLTIDGNRDNRVTGARGGALFYVSASRRIALIDCKAKNSHQEGIQFAGNTGWAGGLSEDCKTINCETDNAYRNGLSLTGTRGFLDTGGNYHDTDGANPEAGVDVEPDGATNPNLGFRFVGTRVWNNDGIGLSIVSSTSDRNLGVVIGADARSNGATGVWSDAYSDKVRIINVTGTGNVTALVGGPLGFDQAQVAGRVIQSTRVRVAGPQSFTGVYADVTSATVTITPRYANSLIRLRVKYTFDLRSAAAQTNAESQVRLVDASGPTERDRNGHRIAGASGTLISEGSGHLAYDDSRGSLTAVTYKLQCQYDAGAASISIYRVEIVAEEVVID